MSDHLQNVLLMLPEQHASKGTARWLILLAIILLSLIASHMVAALIGTHFGYEAGEAAEKARHAKAGEIPRAASFNCAQALRICESQLRGRR